LLLILKLAEISGLLYRASDAIWCKQRLDSALVSLPYGLADIAPESDGEVMPDESSASPRGSTPRPRWRRHVRSWRRRSDALNLDVRLAAVKLDMLEHVGSLALAHLHDLAAREAELDGRYPASAERFQYTIDKIAQAMGREVDELTQRWRGQVK
jgi:hypothetical protein